MEKPVISYVETLILREKFEKLIEYLNECKIFPNKVIIVINENEHHKVLTSITSLN